jgi:hypothetical protein
VPVPSSDTIQPNLRREPHSRRRPKWLWPLIGVLGAGLVVVLILACLVGAPLLKRLLEDEPPATVALAPTVRPTITPRMRAEPAYREDFTAPGQEWEISSGENADYRVEGGVYSIAVKAQNWIAWNAVGVEFDDFEIEFEVALVEGDSYNDAGLLFRFQDRDNYYELDINGEQSLAVGKQIDGEWVQILDWTESPAIQGFGSVNRVRLIAQGDQFEVLVNDQSVARFGDETYSGGGIAPVVTAYDEPPARATFDNIRIWELGP